MKKALFFLCQQHFQNLPFALEKKTNQLSISYQASETPLSWKQAPLNLTQLPVLFSNPITIEPSAIQIPWDLPRSQYKKLSQALAQLRSLLFQENFHSLAFPSLTTLIPSGFETPPKQSQTFLSQLYEENFQVAEKKPLIIDLERSQGQYLVSVEKKDPICLIDSASQIASLALGWNDPKKTPFFLRKEAQTMCCDLKNWDVSKALKFFLKKQSKLPHVFFVNSGSEAVETSIRSIQQAYPKRKNIFAFEGSFHGRTLLALHATFNPVKRTPFECFPNLVKFLPFPEDRTPSTDKPEPSQWVALWSQAQNKLPQIQFLMEQTQDQLLKQEIQTLLQLQQHLQKEPALCVLIEPMLCEGGDRYATSRFFRALRLLTRAYDTPLVFDEVQTGFGMSGKFFWHELFHLTQADGSPDTPDAIALAKKAQIGISLSRFSQTIAEQTSPASILRGYLHALSFQSCPFSEITTWIQAGLESFQKTLGSLIEAPRMKGLCFAFDLPHPAITKALIGARFPSGILIYPAGTRTLRFRLTTSITIQEIADIFLSTYRTFLEISERNLLPKAYSVPPIDTWIQNISYPALREMIQKRIEPGLQKNKVLEKTKSQDLFPKRIEDLKSVSSQSWAQIFKKLFQKYPFLIHSKFSNPISKLQDVSLESLIQQYQSTAQMTWLELLWLCSRRFSGFIQKITQPAAFQRLLPQITALEKRVYEPERQENPTQLTKLFQHPKSIFLAAFSQSDPHRLCAISIAAPLSLFKQVAMVSEDPALKDEGALYSVDLTINPEFQKQGLGTRLKIEQILEARAQHATYLQSRNRFPEANTMIALNQKLGAVTINQNEKDYGGKGTALYQSFFLSSQKSSFLGFDPHMPPMLNKLTLANFISPAYLSSAFILKKVLPPKLRHLYLASSQSECTDKLIKLCFEKKKPAALAFSFEGDFFGTTTATARSLGHCALPFFPWPKIPFSEKSSDETNLRIFKETLARYHSKNVLGLFIEPIATLSGNKKSVPFLKAVLCFCKEHRIPVLFHETRSAFYKYSSEHFFCSSISELQPDGMYFYPTGQLGVIAVNQSLFLEKPLMMISTWDGDEHSLLALRDKILKTWE